MLSDQQIYTQNKDHILLVGTQNEQNTAIITLLRKQGWDVTVIATKQEAVEIMDTSTSNLIVIESKDGETEQDLLERIQAQAELAQLRQKVALYEEQLERERETTRSKEEVFMESHRRMEAFLSLTTHELRTPLTTLKTSIQLLNRRYKTPQTQLPERDMDLLARSGRQVERLERLVKELADHMYAQTGRIMVNCERVNLYEMMQDAIAGVREEYPQRVIHFTIDEAKQIIVNIDQQQMRKALCHYLSNALKYSRDEHEVKVEVMLEDEWVRVSVIDRGIGIEEREQQAIWERFYRVPGVVHQSGSEVGLGLGLFITKTIVELHDGTVGVESAPQRGATFWFRLRWVA